MISYTNQWTVKSARKVALWNRMMTTSILPIGLVKCKLDLIKIDYRECSNYVTAHLYVETGRGHYSQQIRTTFTGLSVPYRTVLCLVLSGANDSLVILRHFESCNPPPHAAKAHLNRKNLSDYCPTNKFKFAQPTKRDSCQLSVRLYYNICVGVLSQEIDCFLLRGESKHRQQSSQE